MGLPTLPEGFERGDLDTPMALGEVIIVLEVFCQGCAFAVRSYRAAVTNLLH